MKSFKAWLLRWLGAASEADLINAIAVSTGDKQRLHDEYRADLLKFIKDQDAIITNLKAEHEAAITQLTHEALRRSDALYTKLHLEINDVIVLLDKLKAEQDASTAELIQELNNVRNSIPAALIQSARAPVRVFRNFREFRTIVEGASKKIPIERNS